MGIIEKFEEEGGTPCCVKCQSHIRGIGNTANILFWWDVDCELVVVVVSSMAAI